MYFYINFVQIFKTYSYGKISKNSKRIKSTQKPTE